MSSLCRVSAPLRALHSFPTRRSSDLGGRGGPVGGALLRASTLGRAQAPDRGGRSRPHIPRPPRAGSARAPAAGTRSEEHTSELQSRGHLVCRLLLEKKKNNVAYTQNA